MAKKKALPQTDLPGMEDREINDLQFSALEYAKIRDKRMKLSQEEVELKQELLALMKKHHRKTYNYNGVEVNVVTEEETVKVRIHKPEEDDEEAA